MRPKAILIEWPREINSSILNNILNFQHSIENHYLLELESTHQAYQSLLVVFVKEIILESVISTLKSLYLSKNIAEKKISHLWKIPVCYDDAFGIDIENICASNSLSKTTLVALHTETLYKVHFIGFLPGFLYLGGLNKKLYVPRKSTPSPKIMRGAVAIGGNQTGVYPMESPGGWNVIGNSPISFFDVKKSTPCFAKPGDEIKFYAIDIKKHKEITQRISQNLFTLESEVIYD